MNPPLMIWRRGWRLARRLQFAPVLGLRAFGHALALGAALLALLFAWVGEARPSADWKGIDILSEGGLGLLLALWLAQLRASRPAGPVTNALALGLAAWMLGSTVDCLDEFWALPRAWWWDNLLESGFSLLGMAALTWGLQGWRREQLALSQDLRNRERDWRDHRRLDPVTALADAAYMADRLAQGAGGRLLMLGFEGHAGLLREQGVAAADRLLERAGQLLCLHLGPRDLVCRYAGDRFVLLLDGPADPGFEESLRAALAGLGRIEARRHAPQRPRGLPVRAAACDLRPAGAAPEALMRELASRLARCDRA